MTSTPFFSPEGFERVREIRVGELEAPDHSTLRGDALLPVMSGGEGGCHTGGTGGFVVQRACLKN